MQHIAVQYAVPKKLAPLLSDIRTWAKAALNACDQKSAEITIRIIDADEMLALNSAYRGKHDTTNVLSFPLQTHPLIGDIAICASVVNEQAKIQGKLPAAHWAHMTVHGILHVAGFDHVDEQEADIMETLEINTLAQLGFNNPYEEGN